jgi:site-specific DNA-methyltransferase (adenine-specific)
MQEYPWLMHGNCLELMNEIPDGSVDMILCDLPYGTTACKWDVVIPFEFLWKHYWRLLKSNGLSVLFGCQPFTSSMVLSCEKYFRYSLVWDKVNKYTGALNANKMPLRRHEDIMVFYKKLPTFNKQFRKGNPFISKRTKGHGAHTEHGNNGKVRITVNNGLHNPCSIIQIKADNKKELGYHPTQKPVELLAYLIKTYTNECEVVLDNTMGSGSTGVACLNTGRRFIGIEKEKKYFDIACKRIEETKNGKRNHTDPRTTTNSTPEVQGSSRRERARG